MIKLKFVKIPEQPYSYKLAEYGEIWWTNPPDFAPELGGSWLINFLKSDRYARHIFNSRVSRNKDFKPKLLFKIWRYLIFLVKESKN